MNYETIRDIITQLKTAKSQNLIKDYLIMQDYNYLYIHFAENTSPETKIALQDYFFSTHKTQNVLINLGHILRIDLNS